MILGTRFVHYMRKSKLFVLQHSEKESLQQEWLTTSSCMANDSFHGTGISLVQFSTVENPGQDRGVKIIDPDVPE